MSSSVSPTKVKSMSTSLGLEDPNLATDTQVKMQDEPLTAPLDLPPESEPTPKSEPLLVMKPKHKGSISPPLTTTPTPQGPQLIGDLPHAEHQALKTFVEISENYYQYGTLGRSREALESMTCDCYYEHGVDTPTDACGHGSDCINRLTQVECLPDDCRCRSYCQNQRFQRREYTAIDIVQTEKKGFGLRAGSDLRKDTFIYEYVGEVVNHPSFKKRMRDYASEGIRHFYFMMLQKDEFIDATKRGGIGRFANHSCNPNCYVAKWTIGDHVRMGIFANRNIKKDEELTFNYNVDRYGHEAQPCFCGEPKCIGFIGGKTQTDIGAMDDLYLEALGITDEVEILGLKGNKKKKGKKLDEDWVPVLKPIVEKDIPKVVQAVRQTQSRKVLFKLLTRMKITEDQAALRQLMRLRGFSLMTNILGDYVKDAEITALALECMTNWPLLARNKVDDSRITVPVQACSDSENEVIRVLAKKLLDYWDTLTTAYRIPKRMKQGDENDESTTHVIVNENGDTESRPLKRSRCELFEDASLAIKPLGTTASAASHSSMLKLSAQMLKPLPQVRVSRGPTRSDIAKVIEAAAAATARPEPTSPAPEENSSSSKKKAKEKKHQTPEEKEANKEKRLQKLVGGVVVKCMSKYQKQMDHDSFKKHAKELTQLIADKEKKSTNYKEGKLDSLSDEKTVKIKKFAKEYIGKIIRKLEKSGHRPKPPTSTVSSASVPSSSTVMDTPNSADGAETAAVGVTIEDVMDVHDDLEQGHGSDEEDEMDDVDQQSTGVMDPVRADFAKDGAMNDDTKSPIDIDTVDPRWRPPKGMETTAQINGFHFSAKPNGIPVQGEEPSDHGDVNGMLVDPPSEG